MRVKAKATIARLLGRDMVQTDFRTELDGTNFGSNNLKDKRGAFTGCVELL